MILNYFIKSIYKITNKIYDIYYLLRDKFLPLLKQNTFFTVNGSNIINNVNISRIYTSDVDSYSICMITPVEILKLNCKDKTNRDTVFNNIKINGLSFYTNFNCDSFSTSFHK